VICLIVHFLFVLTASSSSSVMSSSG